MNTLTKAEVEAMIRSLLRKYHAEYALLFGSYARDEATADSDIDVLVVGGEKFRAMPAIFFIINQREGMMHEQTFRAKR